MLSKNSHLLIVALLGLYGAECCKSFKNIKATIYTGSELDPLEVFLNDGMDEAKEAYSVEIFDQDIPELCDGSIKGLRKLDTLVIKNSGIKNLQAGAFADVPRLRILDLSRNSIKSIPTGVFNNLPIRRLNLSSNSIAEVDSDAFNSMPKLQVIELDYNYIKQIDTAWLKNSPIVYMIDLGYNEITEIPEDAFKNMAESKIRDRPLDIWLTNNKIAEVHPLAFRNIDKIEMLWLSYNNISALSDTTFETVGKINNLELAYNRIKCLSGQFLESLDEISQFNLDGNTLDCDCLWKIRKWEQKRNLDTRSTRRRLACMRGEIDDVTVSQKESSEVEIMDHK